jgi:hypothetical protein
MARKLPVLVVSVCALLISGGLLIEWELPRKDALVANEVDSSGEADSRVVDSGQTMAVTEQAPASHTNDLKTAKISVLRERMRRDGEGLQPELHSDGSETLDLKGRFTHFSAAVRTESGDMRIQCFSGYAPLVDAVSGSRPTNDSDQASNEPVNF